ncbi:hypothetical protein EDD86DRAFT_203222 [Gorgonomyces haynaldii]|nr:hypothetical protein EDD86DRAFT_203222 [Gorgonomyces haynaldii]
MSFLAIFKPKQVAGSQKVLPTPAETPEPVQTQDDSYTKIVYKPVQFRTSSLSVVKGAGYVSGRTPVVELGKLPIKHHLGIELPKQPHKDMTEYILQENTRRNAHPRNTIESINERWNQMMDDIMHETDAIKSKPSSGEKTIKFNETVKCHKIPRIEDLMERFDSDDEGGDELLELAIQEFMDMEEWPERPRSTDEHSINSLGPGCPTPPAGRSSPLVDSLPLGMWQQPTDYMSYSTADTRPVDNLKELERLLGVQETKITLVSIAQEVRLIEPEKPVVVEPKEQQQSLWTRLVKTVTGYFRPNKKTHPL